jgi:hypothetical protein
MLLRLDSEEWFFQSVYANEDIRFSIRGNGLGILLLLLASINAARNLKPVQYAIALRQCYQRSERYRSTLVLHMNSE